MFSTHLLLPGEVSRDLYVHYNGKATTTSSLPCRSTLCGCLPVCLGRNGRRLALKSGQWIPGSWVTSLCTWAFLLTQFSPLLTGQPPGTFEVVTTGGSRCWGHGPGEARDTTDHPSVHRVVPSKRAAWPHMSVLLLALRRDPGSNPPPHGRCTSEQGPLCASTCAESFRTPKSQKSRGPVVPSQGGHRGLRSSRTNSTIMRSEVSLCSHSAHPDQLARLSISSQLH